MARGKRSLDSDWDRLFDELYLKTYAVQRDEEAEALAIGAMRLLTASRGRTSSMRLAVTDGTRECLQGGLPHCWPRGIERA
jgi:hypothetical protein